MVRRGTHAGKAGSNKGKVWALLTEISSSLPDAKVNVMERKFCMRVALSEKEAKLLEIIRGVEDGSVCISIVEGKPENVVVKREIDLEHHCGTADISL